MVDLAKIRRKVREQKEKAGQAGQQVVIDREAPAIRLERYKERLLTAAASREEEEAAAADAVAPMIELLTVDVGSETYGLGVDDVEQIVETRAITPVPNAPLPVSGIVSVRGTIVAVLDVRHRLGASAPPADADPRLVVVKDRGGMAGFPVDRVSRVVKCEPSELEPPPALGAVEMPGAIKAMLRRGDQVVSVIDLDRLLG